MLKINSHLDLLNRLNRFSSAYTKIKTIRELAVSVEAVLDDILDIEFSGLYLYDFGDDRLKLLVAKGFNEDEQRVADQTAMERHPGTVFRTREILNIPDTENDPDQRSISSTRSFIVRSRLYMPVMNGDQAVGAFGIVSSRKNNFDEEAIAVLSFICNIAGGIYGNILTQAELRKTGLIARETDNAVIITGKEGRTEWVNKSFERMTGFTFEEVKGKKPGDLLQGAETDSDIVAAIATAIDREEPIETDLVNYHKEGRPYWVRLQVQPVFNAHGELTNFISIQRDITAQKKVQDEMESVTTRLATLIKNMHSGILVEDQHRRIAILNQTFCNMFSIPVGAEALLGTDCTDSALQSSPLFRDPEQFINRIDHILEARVAEIGEELELADGRVFERDYIPIFQHHKFLGNLWQYRDITLRKKIETDLRKATEDAESANYSKSLFLAKMSHEIRTPLNAVIGLSRLMKETALNQEQKKLNDKLILSGDNLLGIINEILDFSKIEAGRIELESIPFSIRELISRVYSFQEHAAEERMITLLTRVDQRIQTAVTGDPVRLQQVLINLVSNAIKFTHTGSVSISCDLTEEQDDRVRLLFAVTDTGIGISCENQAHIFEGFRQEDETVTRMYGGTGLGLAISRHLVEMMGGQLEVESEKGSGSRFFFSISLATSDEKLLQKTRCKVKFNRQALEGKAILVAEDNSFNQFIIRSIIEKWGAQVTLAENGQIALEMMKENQFDIVLMDIQMPVMDGYTATRMIRSEVSQLVPVIALTANVTKEAIVKAREAGMDEYIAKPFEDEDLYLKLLKATGIEPEFLPGDADPADPNPAEPQLFYDLTAISGMLDHDPGQIRGAVIAFMSSVPDDYKKLIAAFQVHDYEGIKKAAHPLKSNFDLVATTSLQRLIRDIHQYCMEPENRDRLPELFRDLQQDFPIMIEQLEKRIAE